MKHLLMPSQTIGPFPHEGWRWASAVNTKPAAERTADLVVTGKVYDGAGDPVNDAWLEFWSPAAAEAESSTSRAIPGFRRTQTDADGAYRAELSASWGAPGSGIFVTLFSRGLLLHLYSAVFLEDAPDLGKMELLAQVPPARRATLLARRQPDGSYRWDVHLQGALETVFFEFG